MNILNSRLIYKDVKKRTFFILYLEVKNQNLIYDIKLILFIQHIITLTGWYN